MANAATRAPTKRQEHVCVLLDHADDAAAEVAPLIREALQRDARVVAMAGRAALDALRRGLDGLRVPADALESAGQLQLLSWTHVVTHGAFDLARALQAVEAIFANDDPRYDGVQLVEGMDWVVSAAGGSSQVAEFERGIDRLVREHAQPALCVYDTSRLSGQLLMEILATHPLAMVHGRLVESPFYRETP